MNSDTSNNGYQKATYEIARGASIYFFIFLIGISLDYVAKILVARFLGPDSYGLLNLAFGIFNIIAVIALFGLSIGVTRYVSFYTGKDDWSRVNSTIISGRRLVIGSSFVASILLILCAGLISRLFDEPNLKNLIIVFALSLPFFMLGVFYMGVLRGFKKVRYAILSRELFNKGVRVLFIILFIILGRKLLEISIAYFLGFVGFAAYSIFRFFKTVGKRNNDFKFHNVTKELILYSWPLMFSLIFVQTQSKLDSVLLGYFRTAQEVGIYNAALPISQVFIVLSQSFLFIFLPIVSALYAQKKMDDIDLLYKIGTRWITYLSLLIFLIIFLFSKPIIHIMFGDLYLHAEGALKILAVGFFFNSVLVLTGGLLDTIEKTKQHMIGDLIGLATAVMLGFILIPALGVIGTAVAMMSALIVQNMIRFGFVYYYLKFQPFELSSVKFLSISSIVAVGFYLGLKSLVAETPLLVIPISTIIVVVSILLFIGLKGIKNEELEMLRLIEQRANRKFPWLHKILSKTLPQKDITD